MKEERKDLRRPGGELASRPLHFFWVVDCSGSMFGEKIGTLNHAIQETVPEMVEAANDNPNAQLMVRTLQFSTGASWVTANPVKVEDFAWEDLEADGVTDMGKAFEMLSAQLSVEQLGERALPPVIVLLSDGQPTDDYKQELANLLHQPWGKKSVRIAIAIGQDADMKVLSEFTGNRELVLQANNAATLTKMIKWASTVASVVSAPASRINASDGSGESKEGSVAPAIFDMNNIPSPDEAGDGVW